MRVLQFALIQAANFLVAALRACGADLDDDIGDETAQLIQQLHQLERRVKRLQSRAEPVRIGTEPAGTEPAREGAAGRGGPREAAGQ